MSVPAAAVAIRACTPEDAPALALVGAATFLETFAGVLGGADVLAHCQRAHAPETYLAWLQDRECRLFLAVASPGAAPVAYLVLPPPALPVAAGAGDLEVKRIYLLHRFQGSGLGRRLMDAARAHARSIGVRRLLLGVYAHNHDALGFYRRHGYREVGRRTFDVGGTGYEDVVLALDLESLPTASREIA